jgi:ribonuclease R
MLPEVLSNGVCSLQENQPRLTKSAFITYTADGRRDATRFANTVIRSAKRLTYGAATQLLAGKVGGYTHKVVELVRRMDVLARRIRQRRLAAGMLVLDLPGVELVFDEPGQVTGVAAADTSFSHTIIEMFMVEANEVVAELLAQLNVPALRRVHPPPDETAAQPLNRFLRVLELPPVKAMDRAQLQPLLAAVKDRPEAYAVNLAVLRSLEQAIYDVAPLGHFALASDHYTHFTSPIRRYPDLTIHRWLDAYLRGELRSRRGRPDAEELKAARALGAHCSRNERRAEAAERELRQIHVLRLLERQVGTKFEGLVTGVTNFGLFVQLPQYLVEGLLRFADLADDWWKVDSEAGCVVGERTGRRLKGGDTVPVIIAGVNLASRELDLALADRPAVSKPDERRPRGKQARSQGARKAGVARGRKRR